jgi:hypothetical protein
MINSTEVINIRVAISISLFSLVSGILLGMIIISNNSKFDTYKCTTICPNMSRSIQFGEDCYCKAR